jgi:hypothetical protein
MRFQYSKMPLMRTGLACAALVLANWASAADIRFVEGLSAEEKEAIGASKLTTAQVADLDGLVSHDVTAARDGGVTGFSTEFLARRTDSELAASGIDHLSDKERTVLDTLVAREIALGPPPEQEFTFRPPTPKVTPAPPPTPTQVSAPLKAEIHGDVSLIVGGGSHGSSFYGTSFDAYYTDPSGKFTIAVGVDDFHGKGLLPFYGAFEPYGPYSAYGPIGPDYVGPPYWGW